MQIKFFTIPVTRVSDYNDELNLFLRTNKIVEIEKQLIQNSAESYWCLYVSYLEPTVAEKAVKGKIDYMTELEPAVFAKFSELRKIRKTLANKENISAFILFTDAELAEMAKMPEITVAALKNIKGIGTNKAEKYGALLIEMYNTVKNETSWPSDGANSMH